MDIFHVTELSDWREAEEAGEYRLSTRGASLEQVGFIHASTAEQLSTIATALYAGDDVQLVVLVLDDEQLAASGLVVRREDGGNGELYPHIYGPIPTHLLREIRPAQFDDAGGLAY